MDPMIMAYAILGGMSIVALMVIVLVIAGKDIAFAFSRRFNPRGCDVFIANPNRQINHFFEKPKEGVFKIEGNIYITNPNKLLGLSDNMIQQIKKARDKTRNNIQTKIDDLNQRKEFIKKQIESLPNAPENAPLISELGLHYTKLTEHINLLSSKLKTREQAYYMNRRGAYFYIEGDPVPKDFFEFYTEMDSAQLENVIMRAQTKDPKTLANLEATLLFLKKFIIFCLIAGAVASFFAFKNSSVLTQIAEKIGVQLSV